MPLPRSVARFNRRVTNRVLGVLVPLVPPLVRLVLAVINASDFLELSPV